MKKSILLFLAILFVLPSVGNAYVSLSVSGTTSPSFVEAGEKVNLILTIANTGTSVARDVKLSVSPTKYVIPGTYQYDLQSIAAGNSIQVTVPLSISSDAQGTTAVSLSLDFREGDTSGTVTQQNSITLSITKRTLLEIRSVNYSSEVVSPGDNVMMSIEIVNVGKGRIKDLTVSLGNTSLPFVPIGSDSQKYLANLEPGSKSIATFNLVVNKDAKTIAYNFPVLLSYFDELGNSRSEQRTVGLKVTGVPDFVSNIEKSENLFSGQEGKMTISVSNVGTASASFLTARFDSALDMTPKEIYIGNLDPDDSSSIVANVNLRDKTAGKYNFVVNFVYKDPYNQEFTKAKQMEFSVTQRPIEISSNMQIIIILVVLGVLYFKRNWIKSKLKRK